MVAAAFLLLSIVIHALSTNQDFDISSIAVLDLSLTPGDLKQFNGGFTDGTYGYLVPYANPQTFGTIARFSLADFSTVAVLDLTQTDPLLTGFNGGFSDSLYGYLVPAERSNVVRFALSTFQVASVLDLAFATKHAGLKGFIGGFRSGEYGYLVPFDNHNGYFGMITRFSTTDFATVSVLDVASTNGNLQGFIGGFTDGVYGYVVPHNTVADVVRFTLSTFANIVVIDLELTDGDLHGFRGGFTDSTYGYLVPAANGKVARFRLDDVASVSVLDLSPIGGDLNGFLDGFTDGIYGYLCPHVTATLAKSGKVVRFDLEDFGGVTVLDVEDVDGKLKGFHGCFTDGSHGYLVPHIADVASSLVVRFDLSQAYEVNSKDGGCTDLAGDVGYLNDPPYSTVTCALACDGYLFFTITPDWRCKCHMICNPASDDHTVFRFNQVEQAATDAAQCSASNVGYSWDLVRRTTSNTFPDTDQLKGSSVHGTPHDNPLGASFAKAHDAADFNEFLFTTGDCSRWMIMRRSEVLAWYTNEPREILASHTSSIPYSARMYRRASNLEDPWITFSDHGTGTDAHCNALYQEDNNDPVCSSGDLGTLYQGLNVFLRKAGRTYTIFAAGGCATASDDDPDGLLPLIRLDSQSACQAECDLAACGWYSYNPADKGCILHGYSPKMTRGNGYPASTCYEVVQAACGPGYVLLSTSKAFAYCGNSAPGSGSPPTAEFIVSAGAQGAAECEVHCDADPMCTHYTKYGVNCDGACDTSLETRCRIIRQCGDEMVQASTGSLGAITCKKAICSYPSQGSGYPAGSYRRCGASDTLSAMCVGTTNDGRLYVSEAEIHARCTADATCAGYGEDLSGGYYRPVTNIPSINSQSHWHTYAKHCQACPSTCPSYCGTCQAGSIDDGGVALVHGKCPNYCSKFGFCGATTNYMTDGADCTCCVESSYHQTPTEPSTTTSTASPSTSSTTTVPPEIARFSLLLNVASAAQFAQDPAVKQAMRSAAAKLLDVIESWIQNLALEVDNRRLSLTFPSNGEGRELYRKLNLEVTTRSGVNVQFDVVVPPDGGPGAATARILMDRFDSRTIEEASDVINQVMASGTLGTEQYTIEIVQKTSTLISEAPTTPAPSPNSSESATMLVVILLVASSLALSLLAASLIIWRKRIFRGRGDKEGRSKLMTARFQADAFSAMQLLAPPKSISAECKECLCDFVSKMLDCSEPAVIVCFAVGQRNDDDNGAGPGLFYAAAAIRALFENRISCFCALPGAAEEQSWRDMLGGANTQCKVLLVVETSAVYSCRTCLEQLHCAELGGASITCLRFENSLPTSSAWWSDVPKMVAQDNMAQDVFGGMRSKVVQALKFAESVPDLPDTVFSSSDFLDSFALGLSRRLAEHHIEIEKVEPLETYGRAATDAQVTLSVKSHAESKEKVMEAAQSEMIHATIEKRKSPHMATSQPPPSPRSSPRNQSGMHHTSSNMHSSSSHKKTRSKKASAEISTMVVGKNANSVSGTAKTLSANPSPSMGKTLSVSTSKSQSAMSPQRSKDRDRDRDRERDTKSKERRKPASTPPPAPAQS